MVFPYLKGFHKNKVWFILHYFCIYCGFFVFMYLVLNTNMNRKMVLRNKLRSMQISITDNGTNYFMRIIQLCDHIACNTPFSPNL
jgi:hypothetical protein